MANVMKLNLKSPNKNMKPNELIKGHYYFQITYPERTLTQPVIGSYEFIETEKLESDDPDREWEVYYIFDHHPTYRYELEEENKIAFTFEQVGHLCSIEALQQELREIIQRQTDETRLKIISSRSED